MADQNRQQVTTDFMNNDFQPFVDKLNPEQQRLMPSPTGPYQDIETQDEWTTRAKRFEETLSPELFKQWDDLQTKSREMNLNVSTERLVTKIGETSFYHGYERPYEFTKDNSEAGLKIEDRLNEFYSSLSDTQKRHFIDPRSCPELRFMGPPAGFTGQWAGLSDNSHDIGYWGDQFEFFYNNLNEEQKAQFKEIIADGIKNNVIDTPFALIFEKLEIIPYQSPYESGKGFEKFFEESPLTESVPEASPITQSPTSAMSGTGNQVMGYSEDVKALQQALIDADPAYKDMLSYTDKNGQTIAADGLEGPKTRAAIEDYAQKNNLDPRTMNPDDFLAHIQEKTLQQMAEEMDQGVDYGQKTYYFMAAARDKEAGALKEEFASVGAIKQNIDRLLNPAADLASNDDPAIKTTAPGLS